MTTHERARAIIDAITDASAAHQERTEPHAFTPDPTGTACGICGGWPDDLAHSAPARAAEWQPLTTNDEDDQSRIVKPEIRDPFQSSAATDAGTDNDCAGTKNEGE